MRKLLVVAALCAAVSAYAEPTTADLAIVERYRAVVFAPTAKMLVKDYGNQKLYQLSDKTWVWVFNSGYTVAQTPDGVIIRISFNSGAEDSRWITLPSGRSCTIQQGSVEWSLAMEPAPDFALPVLGSPGKTVKLSDLRGTFVLLDFWASWCGPCMQALPTTQALYEKYKSRGLLVYGIDIEGDEAKAAKASQSLGLTFPILMAEPGDDGQHDWSAQQISDYGITGIPAMFLIDKNGVVLAADSVNDKTLEKYLQ